MWTWGSRRKPGRTRGTPRTSTSTSSSDSRFGIHESRFGLAFPRRVGVGRTRIRRMPPSRVPGPRPRKALGQHFLRDTGVLADIVAAVRVPEGGLVVEIGAGTGQLTEALLEAGHEVVALEVEGRLVPHLRKRFGGNPRLSLVLADARDM